jgi:anaerobic selenocysteine-containing dehydrogenase
MLDAAADGELDVLLSAGGNWMEVLPDPRWVEAALERVGLRVHLDLVLTPQMLVPGGDVLVLPAASRYEIPGGCTSTSTERRIIFSPEIPGSRVPLARGEWDVLGEIAARVRPGLRDAVRFATTQAVRDEIGALVTMYAGIETLREKGDQIQYGGRRLCEGGIFPLPGGRARFVPATPPVALGGRDDRLRVTTRRGKQFNSMVHEQGDAITGAQRDDVLLARADVDRLGLAEGDRIVLRSERGELAGRVKVAELLAGNAQVHWPEGNVLLDRKARSPEAGIPDYNAWVTVARA